MPATFVNVPYFCQYSFNFIDIVVYNIVLMYMQI